MRDMRSRTKGKVVVIAGPSGVGKNSVIVEVIKRCPHCSEIITATTRPPRAREKHKVDYYFMTETEFKKHVAKRVIPEFRIHPTTGARYGTYLPDLTKRLARGDIAMGDFNIEGVRYLKKKYGTLAIFIMPPSFGALEKRIRARNADMSKDELKKRLVVARQEIKIHAPHYDYRVVNKEGALNKTVDKVIEIMKKEGYAIV